MTDDISLFKERVDLRVRLWSALIAAVGIITLFISTPVHNLGYHKLGALFEEIGAALFIAGVLAVVWELTGKRAFADEILAKANMARDLADAGIDTITESFKDQRINWDALFRNACRLDLFVSWGATWRNTQSERIEKLLSEPDGKLRVVLPDPESKEVVNSLANRFSMENEKVKQMILEASAFYQHHKEKAHGKGKVEIYFTAIAPLFTFYRFNNKAILALYNHRTEKLPVPAAMCNSDGFMFRFLSEEFEGILADERTRRTDKEEDTAERVRGLTT